MVSYIAIAEQLIIDQLLHPRQPVVKKSIMGLGLMALSAFLALVGLGFVFAALYIWLADMNGPLSASLSMSAVLFTLALITVFAAFTVKRWRKRKTKAKATAKDFPHNIQGMIETVTSELGDTIRDNPKAALITALVAGYMAKDKFN